MSDELSGLEKRKGLRQHVRCPHDERVGPVHDDEVAHAVEPGRIDSDFAIVLGAEDAVEDRIAAATAGDDADLERRRWEASRDAILASADLLAGRAGREAVDPKVAQAVGETRCRG